MSSDSNYSLKFVEDIENNLLYRSPYFVPSFLLGYILFVTWIGPSFMKTRKPFNLQKTLVSYNLIEVFINVYITYWSLAGVLYQLVASLRRSLCHGWQMSKGFFGNSTGVDRWGCSGDFPMTRVGQLDGVHGRLALKFLLWIGWQILDQEKQILLFANSDSAPAPS
ncbi:hypothetical protein AVEN_73034-1 [Araneus ventricosus]|uniref:Uncharacterized protein n=1 Tax=Araneus ventricosus TaxID=182803 RepID=A0A4Y2V690_ARAVE|nr:hypothetical protein AVEN_73034-1 [Araneus ventricosus]